MLRKTTQLGNGFALDISQKILTQNILKIFYKPVRKKSEKTQQENVQKVRLRNSQKKFKWPMHILQMSTFNKNEKRKIKMRFFFSLPRYVDIKNLMASSVDRAMETGHSCFQTRLARSELMQPLRRTIQQFSPKPKMQSVSLLLCTNAQYAGTQTETHRQMGTKIMCDCFGVFFYVEKL